MKKLIRQFIVFKSFNWKHRQAENKGPYQTIVADKNIKEMIKMNDFMNQTASSK